MKHKLYSKSKIHCKDYKNIIQYFIYCNWRIRKLIMSDDRYNEAETKKCLK